MNSAGLSQELQARDALVAVVGVRKHFADVAESAGAQQRIRDGVTQHVAVGMSDQSFFVRNLDAAKNQSGWQARADAGRIQYRCEISLRCLFLFEKDASQSRDRKAA